MLPSRIALACSLLVFCRAAHAAELPREARRHMLRGKAAVKDGSLQDAADEFRKAALAAPDYAPAYYNLGLVEDKAAQYDAAISDLQTYLKKSPKAADRRKVEDLIDEIGYRRDKAAKQGAAPAAAGSPEQEFLKSINGARFEYEVMGRNGRRLGSEWFEIHGDEAWYFLFFEMYSAPDDNGHYKINGRNISPNHTAGRAMITGECYIHEDGSALDCDWHNSSSSGSSEHKSYQRR